jgi:quercetin dioxygenase-like cupin family protein
MKTRTIINPIVKDKVTFIKLAAETNNEYSLIQVELAPKGGNDLHYHDVFTETFEPIKGELGVTLNGEEHILVQGDSVTAPLNELHRFYNPSDTEYVTFHVKLQPASRNFEEFLQIMYGLARAGKTNKKGLPTSPLIIGAVGLLGETYPPKKHWISKISVVLRWLGKIAKRKGILDNLRKQYVEF